MARVACASVLVLLALCCCLARTTPASRKSLRSIDCRRLVFHPQCRGVAAKRSMPNLLEGLQGLEGLEARYQFDLSRDPEPVPAPVVAALSDPVLAGLLGRLAETRRGGGRDAEARQDAHQDGRQDARQDAHQDVRQDAVDGGDGWSSAVAAEQDSAKAADLGRFEWQARQAARKRMKEQEVTYDY